MAESDKTEHISESIMERFSVRNLSESELTNVARHVTRCPDCQAEFVSSLRRQRGDADLSFTLAPECWLRHEHLDYEQLVEFAEGTLDATNRELIDAHLKVCPPCQEDVRSFLAFREQIAPELRVSYSPEKETAQKRLSLVNWWRDWTWSPAYSVALVVIGIALVIGAAVLLNRREESQQAQQSPTPQVSPGLTPDDRSAHLPSPNESPSEKPNSTEAVAVLNDRGGTISVDRSGNVSGLDDVPKPVRDEIAQALLSSRIDRPAILKELSGQDSALRGSNSRQPFKLISPARSVIVSNRPTFKWESMPAASAYTIYITDSNGQLVARSDQLAIDRREWRVPNSLKRGQIYSWTVTALVDGKEVTAPGPSAPEMKFQVLSAADLGQLNRLKQVRSDLALGIFYAKVGLIAEAEREFQTVVRQNPSAPIVERLLKQIQSWRKR